jgi:RNA polymerase sigma factor (sigma-70 family)
MMGPLGVSWRNPPVPDGYGMQPIVFLHNQGQEHPNSGRINPVSEIRALRPARVIPLSSQVNSEQALYLAIQEDRPGWKREIFDHYVSLVRGLIGKSLGPRDDMEDLVADVFVGLFESAPNIRSADTMRSYVVSVVLNTVRREFKRRKRRRLFFATDMPSDEVERVAGTDDPRAKVALRQLSRLLDELSEDERLVYVLHVLEGLSLSDVTENLNMSRSTVKRRLKRASERMLRRVEKNPLLTDYIKAKAGDPDE